MIYCSISGEAQRARTKVENPAGPRFLDRPVGRDPFPASEADLEHYAGQFRLPEFVRGLPAH
jgi:hypothetical protein